MGSTLYETFHVSNSWTSLKKKTGSGFLLRWKNGSPRNYIFLKRGVEERVAIRRAVCKKGILKQVQSKEDQRQIQNTSFLYSFFKGVVAVSVNSLLQQTVVHSQSYPPPPHPTFQPIYLDAQKSHIYRILISKGTPLCHAYRFTYLSLEITPIDSHISFDKNWFSPFKSEITSSN